MTKDILYGYFESPVGVLKYAIVDGFVTQLDFSDLSKDELVNERTRFAELEEELTQYFKGKLKEFHVKVRPEVTSFRKTVLDELIKVPYGKTVTYSELAAKINKPRAYRAVAQALHNNPIAIIIPCHRVIGKNGKLVGYGGGLDKKEFLLTLESH